MPIKEPHVPGYGPGTRPNANIESRVCFRGFAGSCGQTSRAYDPTTQTQQGHKSHGMPCQQWRKVSGAAALQSERSCPRLTPEEMVELKKQAALQHPVEGASAGAIGSTAPSTVSAPGTCVATHPVLAGHPPPVHPPAMASATRTVLSGGARLQEYGPPPAPDPTTNGEGEMIGLLLDCWRWPGTRDPSRPPTPPLDDFKSKAPSLKMEPSETVVAELGSSNSIDREPPRRGPKSMAKLKNSRCTVRPERKRMGRASAEDEDESRAEKRARTDKLALGTSCDSCDSSDSSDADSNRGDGRCETMLPNRRAVMYRCTNTTDLKQQEGRWLCRMHILPECSLKAHCQFVTGQPLRPTDWKGSLGRERQQQQVQLTDAMRDSIHRRFGAHAVSAKEQFVCRRCSKALSAHRSYFSRFTSPARPAQQSAAAVTHMREQHGRSGPWLELARLQSQLNDANALNKQLQKRVSEAHGGNKYERD